MVEEKRMFVGGKWVEGSGGVEEVRSPIDGSPLARVPRATIEDARRALDEADKAFRDPTWRKIDPSERGRILQRIASGVRERAEEIAKIESLNVGKPLRESRADVRFAAETLEYYAGLADKIEGSVVPVSGERLAYVLREPLGPTVHFVPWNYPFQLAIRSIAPALACGNTVVAKPATLTPLSLLLLAEIVEKCGVPPGVFNVITGPGSTLGPTLVSDERVRGAVLTGSVETGQSLLEHSSRALVPVLLELGGKSPNIVFSDSDLDRAVKGVAHGFLLNAGQMCWAGSRLLVEEGIHDLFLERLVEYVRSWKLGHPLEKETRMGPLISLHHRERVHGFVERAVKEGGRIVCGGKFGGSDLPAGAYYEPTILAEVSPRSEIAQKEVFGPVLSVFRFRSEAEAVELANSVDFGLYSGIWTRDLSRAHRVARLLECGQVAINEYPVTFPSLPFLGWKRSGIGSEQGVSALEFYTRRKSVVVHLG